MANSVAGQIRIDILSNAEQFKAGVRSAGTEGLGGFAEEYEKAAARIEKAQKRIAASLPGRDEAWVRAMRGGNVGEGPLQGVAGMLGGFSNQQAAFMRHDEMLRGVQEASPWGMSMRTELSREAALTAAAIGAEKQKTVGSLKNAISEIGSTAASAGGFGGMMGQIGQFALGHPLLIAGSLAAGAMINQVRQRDELAREVRRNAETLGQGAEDTSRMMGAGFDQPTLSKFQRSMSEQSKPQMEAYGKLGLDPNKLAAEPMIKALDEVASAFGNLPNAADRANAAIALFGRGGADMISTLSQMKEKMDLLGGQEIIKPADVERTKAWDHAYKGAANTVHEYSLAIARLGGGESGIATGAARMFEFYGKLARFDFSGIGKMGERIRKEDYNIAHADELEAARVKQAQLANEAERFANAWKKAGQDIQGTLSELDAKLQDQREGEGSAARSAFHKKAEEEARLFGQDYEKRKKEAAAGYHESYAEWNKRMGLDLNSMSPQQKKVNERQYDATHDQRSAAEAKFNEGRWSQSGKDLESARYTKTMLDYDNKTEGLKKGKEAEEQKKKDEADVRSREKRLKTPEDKYNDEIARDKELFEARRIGLEEYNRFAQKALEDYYKEAEGLDAKAIRKRLKTGHDEFSEGMKNLREHGGAIGLSPDEIKRESQRRSDAERKHLGVKDPLGDYVKDLLEHRKALADKTITPDEFDAWQKRRRRQAVGDMTAEEPEVHPAAAMAAGSREAHALIAQSAMGDPKTALVADAVKKLETINAKLAEHSELFKELIQGIKEAIV